MIMSNSIRIVTFALALIAGTAGAMADYDGYRSYSGDYASGYGNSSDAVKAFWENQARNGS
jgi:hypothetical protein